jgi:3-oxoacyl-[acyl-carrier-protein] synthase-1
MSNAGAWIVQTGMVTAVGIGSAQTASSVRAGISRYQESAVYNKRFEPMTLALLPDAALPPLHDDLAQLPGFTSRQMRMLRLADGALKEVLKDVNLQQPPPLLLAGPEPFADRPAALTPAFVQQLMTQTGVKLDAAQSAVFPAGRAGGLLALRAALALLAQGKHDYALVGGVDSYLDLYLLATLDQADRVLAPGVMDGFCPGEGAGFVLLCSERVSKSHTPLARVHAPGIGAEPGHRYSKEPYRGDGLATAVNEAVADCQQPLQTVLCSLNGENFGVKEWGVAFLRNKAAFAEPFEMLHPADCCGDLGAAFAPVLIGLAAIGMHKQYLSTPCLVWCSSEYEQRGAVCVSSNLKY